MQKVNVDVHIWNELRSNDRFGFQTQIGHYTQRGDADGTPSE